jgi:hypothetical protein
VLFQDFLRLEATWGNKFKFCLKLSARFSAAPNYVSLSPVANYGVVRGSSAQSVSNPNRHQLLLLALWLTLAYRHWVQFWYLSSRRVNNIGTGIHTLYFGFPLPLSAIQ